MVEPGTDAVVSRLWEGSFAVKLSSLVRLRICLVGLTYDEPEDGQHAPWGTFT